MSKKLRWQGLILLITVATAGWQGGCGREKDGETADPGRIRIVATTGMIGDLARRVAGEHADVDVLMGPGVDPHLYKASEGDVRRLGNADVILYNGLHLEGKMTGILGGMASRQRVVALAEQIPEERLLRPAEFEGAFDPHVWFDVSLWALVVDPLTEALAEADPVHAEDYRTAGEALRAELVELDTWTAAEVERIPQDQRTLVTAHDAFGYFGQRYGMEVMGIQGLSTVTEAGLRDMDRVVDVVVSQKLKAIFVESSVSPRSIEAVQAACVDRGHAVALGGELFSDSMGSEGTPEGSYDGMVRHNVRTLGEALR